MISLNAIVGLSILGTIVFGLWIAIKAIDAVSIEHKYSH